jgi:hypothetical protein
VGWTDDLTPRDGYSYPVPTSVGFTIAESVQPVVAGGRVFVGTMDGTAFAIDANDGTTLWSAPLAGGTVATAAVSGNVVVFAGATGIVAGFRSDTGSLLWSFDCGKAVTGAPAVRDGTLYVADHGGTVHARDVATGNQVWRSPRLPAPVEGGLAVDDTSVYVGAEDMVVYALRRTDGTVRAQHRVRGQSFRMLWPVAFGTFVWAHSATTPVIGSEYVMETLMADSPDLETEQNNIARWLAGDTNGGRWADAGDDWRHVFALRKNDLGEPFTVLAGPADGVGCPAHPVVIDNAGRVLTYFKTRYPRFTKLGAFGTQYSIDIAAVDPATGRRIPIDNGKLANPWPWETDNLYGLSVGGTQLWLRQNFRGTQVHDLASSTARGVTAEIRHRDGGNFMFDVVYKDQDPPIATSEAPLLGRTAPAISGSRVYIAETFGITALERKP